MKTIPNLIWTDLAANMLVGTRSWGSGTELPPNLQKRDGASGNNISQGLVPVTVYEQQIRYRWVFAIPAFLALLLFVLVLLAAMVSVLSRRGLPARVRYYLFHLSSGRLLAENQYPGECDKLAPTNQWLARVGKRPSSLASSSFVNHTSDEAVTSMMLGPSHMASGATANEKHDETIHRVNQLRTPDLSSSESAFMLGPDHAKSHAAADYTRLNGHETARVR